MKIKLVGTGSIGANERSASTLIDDKLLVDLGNGIAKTIVLQGDRLEDIESILITHLHGDHYADIPFYFNKSSSVTPVPAILSGVQSAHPQIPLAPCPCQGDQRKISGLAFILKSFIL